jgi:hypothetical protein
MDVEQAMAEARIVRDYLAAQRPAGDTDLAPILWFERDGTVVTVVHCPDVNRDQALIAAQLGVGGYCADSVIVVMDSHVSPEETKPGGGAWGPGEMQRACDEENACELGTLSDCLIVVDATRSGAVTTSLCRYREDKASRSIEWDDATTFPQAGAGSDDGLILEGLVPDALREAFDVPPLAEVLRQSAELSGVRLSAEEAQGLADHITSTALAGLGYEVLLPRGPT